MRPSVLAVVPARANSKRIPGKNRKSFLGKPLIFWTIEAALNSRCVVDVAVTTDDSEILKYASQFPNVKFIKRPDNLALDSTPGVDPVLHLMGTSEFKFKYDVLLLLQPTSPLRSGLHIDQAFDLFLKSGKNQLVSVKKMSDQLGHVIFGENNKIEFLRKVFPALPNDQELKVLNGAIYFTYWNSLLEEKSFVGSSLELFEMDERVSVDIDYPEDWKRAEIFARMEE